ncbi:DNA-directed RNA polymerase subunit E'' [Candidatus Woesearchaeota archaeon]|nr:MAG: DNA-directed RNA polymerase subunit E'' [Candidatus Woesearchaeota archaeon]
MKKKVCKRCKIFVEGELCPICKKDSFTTVFQGLIHFLNVEKSVIAHKMGVEKNGEYALKIR